MKTKIIFILLCFLSLNVMGQGVITRNKCKTCGKVISRCPYKGKHPTTPKPTPKPKPNPTPKPTPKIEPQRQRISATYQNGILSINGVSYKMVYVEGGTFQMGATPEQSSPDSDEKPVHSVTLSSYYIGETEVTQALWETVMGNNPSNFKGSSNPVEKVSWNDCQEFISRLNSLTGQRFRLPTEAEWEYAARGGNKSRGYQYSGSNNLFDVAWYTDNSGSKTHPVKTKQANELGIYDMSGNVWEWCQDWYGSYGSSSQTNPTGPASGSYRVYRGGSWNFDVSYCRLSCRYFYSPGFTYNFLGLRLALSE